MSQILGIDEAGRGCVIGPLVIAGVLFKEKDLDVLKNLGVTDSKKISRQMRKVLYEKLMELCRGAKVEEISPQVIDKHNLNEIELKSFCKIINCFNPQKVYLDAPTNPKGISKFSQLLKSRLKNKDMEIIAENKADLLHPVVGAASIIAKVKRDSIVEKLRKKYGDFGWGYPTEEKVKVFLQNITKEKIKIVRRKWKTFKDLVFQIKFDF